MIIKQSKEFYYRVQVGDNLLVLCEKYNTCKDNIIRNNWDIDFYAGEWIIIKENEYKRHIVKPMQTLKIISSIYGVDEDKIKNDNNLVSDKLFIGQMLKIY